MNTNKDNVLQSFSRSLIGWIKTVFVVLLLNKQCRLSACRGIGLTVQEVEALLWYDHVQYGCQWKQVASVY